jgi:hypothetical protein
VEGSQYAIAQAFRPRFGADAVLTQHWSLSASGAWSSGRSFHAYDSVTSSFLLSYTRERGFGKAISTETASLAYPLRFSFGLQQQSFYDFPGQGRTQVVPAAQVTF